MEGDAAKREVVILHRKIDLQDQQLIGKDAIIENLNKQIENYKTIESTKTEQIKQLEELSDRLEADKNKAERFKNIFAATSGVGGVAILVLITLF